MISVTLGAWADLPERGPSRLLVGYTFLTTEVLP